MEATPAAGFVVVVLVVLAVETAPSRSASVILTCLVEALLGVRGDCCCQDKVAAHVGQVQEGAVVHAEAIVGSLPVVWGGG